MNAFSTAPRVSLPPVEPFSLRMFDGLAPFFHDSEEQVNEQGAINWSKIPFARLERDGALDWTVIDKIMPVFEIHVRTMAYLGYNAISIDDLSHLVRHEGYSDALNRKLLSYKTLYTRIFGLAKELGLKIFVITDYMFYNREIELKLVSTGQKPADLFSWYLHQAFATFPQIDGVVLRFGEGDGVDVEGDFHSRLTLQKPSEARALLQKLVPTFERWNKTLIVRTWTLGAYQIGDLMWNPSTFDAIFDGIESPNLIVSLKYGDSDFFRYLELNPLFFHGQTQKIVELQCRREYEGMGEYPSFVGWMYARYISELRSRGANLVGIYAIQAGGWAPFRKLSFNENPSIWNEVNTFVTAKLALGTHTVEEAVIAFCEWRGIPAPQKFIELLQYSEQAIEEGLYIREFAERPIYFRRVHIPTLAWVFWNNVTAGGLIGLTHRYLVKDKHRALREGWKAVECIQEMLRLARTHNLPEDGLEFQLDSFTILAELRQVLFAMDEPETRKRLEDLIKAYSEKYGIGYRFDMSSTSRVHFESSLSLVFPILIRHHMHYRPRDRVMLNRYITRGKARVVRRIQNNLPQFVDKQGMSSDVLLR